MTTLKASQARIPTEVFNRVVYKGEAIRVEHRSAGALFLISEDEYKAFRDWEDMMDLKAFRKAKKEFLESGEKAIPWSQAKKELGLE
ncbi:MAG TPA: hypothetical protein PKH07_16730 [bacterium]|nr:hypothetical protein [bacterium]